MYQLSGILFHMNLVDSDAFFPSVHLNVHMTIAADWKIKLRNLVILRIVRIEIVFPVKFTMTGYGTVCSQTYCRRIFHNLLIQHRKRTRHSGTDRTGMGIRRTAEGSAAATENLCFCRQLHMDFQSDDGFILSAHLFCLLSGQLFHSKSTMFLISISRPKDIIFFKTVTN